MTHLTPLVSSLAKKARGKRQRSKTRRRFVVDLLEQRVCLSAVAFETHDIDCCPTQQYLIAADFDNDGDEDILANANGIAWYANTDGNGTFSKRRMISKDSPSSMFAADVDGDQDPDVLAVLQTKIVWYENIDGRGSFSKPQSIFDNLDEPVSVFAKDLDNDGDLDLVTASRYKIAWYENVDGAGTFGEQREIMVNTVKVNSPLSVLPVDMDGDGNVDILFASQRENKIAWYENTDGQGNFGEQHVISTNASGIQSLSASDLDRDGDLDVIAGMNRNVSWYENKDGRGTYGEPHEVTFKIGAYTAVRAGDFDGDGDADVLVASDDSDDYFAKVVWVENTDGRGTFGNEHLIVRDSVYPKPEISDTDGDGDLDILLADGSITWYKNTDGLGSFKSETVVNDTSSASSVLAADLDGDGDLDAVATFYVAGRTDWYAIGRTAWYENSDGKGTFGNQRVVPTSLRPMSVLAEDVDGDGDNDLIGVSIYGFCCSEVTWSENTDGRGTFGEPQVIFRPNIIEWSIPAPVAAGDLDGDGDIDIVTTDGVWLENTDGRGTFSEHRWIAADNGLLREEPIATADIDGDNDIDVISGPYWFENTDGRGTFGAPKLFSGTTVSLADVYPADVDGDGDIDIVAAQPEKDRVVWFENKDGRGFFGNGGEQLTISNQTRST